MADQGEGRTLISAASSKSLSGFDNVVGSVLSSAAASSSSKSLGGFENVEDVSFAASSKCRSVLSSAAAPPSSKSLDVPFAAPPREEIDNTERNHQKGKDEGKEYNDDVEF